MVQTNLPYIAETRQICWNCTQPVSVVQGR